MVKIILASLLAFTDVAPPPAAAPVGPTASPAAQVAMSDLELPIEVPRAAIESAIEGLLVDGDPNGTLYTQSGIGIKHGTAEVTIVRAGAVGVSVQGDGSLDVVIPLEVKARLDLQLWRIKHHDTLNGRLTVRGTIRADVTPEWRLSTRTSLAFTWDHKPTLHGISLGSFTEGLVQAELDRFSAAIDATVLQRVDLRRRAELALPPRVRSRR